MKNLFLVLMVSLTVATVLRADDSLLTEAPLKGHGGAPLTGMPVRRNEGAPLTGMPISKSKYILRLDVKTPNDLAQCGAAVARVVGNFKAKEQEGKTVWIVEATPNQISKIKGFFCIDSVEKLRN